MHLNILSYFNETPSLINAVSIFLFLVKIRSPSKLKIKNCKTNQFLAKKQNGFFFIVPACLNLRPNYKIPMFRVTRPYLNLLVKPSIFFQVFWKKINLCILKGEMPFQMHKIILFSERKKIKQNMCACPLPKTHLFFLFILNNQDRH